MIEIPFFRCEISDDKLICPWCEHAESVWNNPSQWVPSFDGDYNDKESECVKCKKSFYVSAEYRIDYTFTSRYKKYDEFDPEQVTLRELDARR